MEVDVEKIVRELIDKTIHMSLATVSSDRPWVCEVHFVYDDKLNLYFRSKPSRRHSQEIATNPRVAGNIVRQHELGEYPAAIYFEGGAAKINDPEVQRQIFPLFEKRLGVTPAALDEAQTPDGHTFYKISVENWYAFGKFNDTSGEKYELKWNGGQ